MQYSLPLLAAAQTSGVLFADVFFLSPGHALIGGGFCFVLHGATAIYPRLRFVCALGAGFFLGAFCLTASIDSDSSTFLGLSEDAVVEATVCDGPSSSKSHVFLKLCSATRVPGPGSLNPAPDFSHLPNIAVRARTGEAEGLRLMQLKRGQRVRSYLRLSRIEGLRNPGGRDAWRQARRRGIGVNGRLLNAALVVRLPEFDEFSWASPGPVEWIRRTRSRAAGLLLNSVDSLRIESGGALMAALALGDRSGLSRSAQESFSRLGVSHLLAVSGLHMALLVGFSYRAVFWVSRMWVGSRPYRDRRQLALACAVVLAAGYSVWAGFGVPVQRSLILFFATWVIWLSHRRPPMGQALTLAFVVILLFSPSALFELGMQLSFVATAGLLFAARFSERERLASAGSFGMTFTQGIRASSVAIALTAPLIVQAGLPLSPSGLLFNVIAIPWVTFILLPLALVGSVLVLIPGGLAESTVFFMKWLLGWTMEVARVVSDEWPLVPLYGFLNWPVFVFLLGMAFLVVWVPRTVRSVTLCFCVLGWVASLPVIHLTGVMPRIVMLDVAQGDAVLVQGRSGIVLVDGGRAFEAGGDMGRSVVAPALRALGVNNLAAVVASHSDIDHRGGLPYILENFPVAELWLPDVPDGKGAFKSIRELAEKHGITIRLLAQGDPDRVVGDLRFKTLWPMRSASEDSVNENSLVLRVEIAGRRVLLTGDIGERSEWALFDQGLDLRADVLKVAHHGSARSSTNSFIRAVNPEVALVSASCAGLSGLPSPLTLQRLEKADVSVWWTGRAGAVEVSFEPNLEVAGSIRVSGWGGHRICPAAESSIGGELARTLPLALP